MLMFVCLCVCLSKGVGGFQLLAAVLGSLAGRGEGDAAPRARTPGSQPAGKGPGERERDQEYNTHTPTHNPQTTTIQPKMCLLH